MLPVLSQTHAKLVDKNLEIEQVIKQIEDPDLKIEGMFLDSENL